jgi:hypothetical protein
MERRETNLGGQEFAMLAAQVFSEGDNHRANYSNSTGALGFPGTYGLTGEVFASPSRNFSVAFHTTAKARNHKRPLSQKKKCSVE